VKVEREGGSHSEDEGREKERGIVRAKREREIRKNGERIEMERRKPLERKR
jgi:hypothetical protein